MVQFLVDAYLVVGTVLTVAARDEYSMSWERTWREYLVMVLGLVLWLPFLLFGVGCEIGMFCRRVYSVGVWKFCKRLYEHIRNQKRSQNP